MRFVMQAHLVNCEVSALVFTTFVSQCVVSTHVDVVSKRLNASKRFLVWKLPSAYATFLKAIHVIPKIGVVPS